MDLTDVDGVGKKFTLPGNVTRILSACDEEETVNILPEATNVLNSIRWC